MMMMRPQFICSLLLTATTIALLTAHARAATILFFLLGTSPYERHTFEFIAQQIALRHHNTITVKPILIPDEPRLVVPRLHMVHEKLIKNLLNNQQIVDLVKVGGDVPWRRDYELDAYNEPYWRAHNYSCEKMLNSNLMTVLKRDQIDVAVVHSGNPCQLALLHALSIPFIYVDLEGLTDETIVASGTPWNLAAPSSRLTPSLAAAFGSPVVALLAPLHTGIQLLREAVCQSGQLLPQMLAFAVCPRARLLDEPISRLFADDYEIKRAFKKGFPHVNWIKQNAELYFINTDLLVEPPNTALPAHVVPMGGAHIDFPKPLFAPWNTSIGASQIGIIIVQLGANVDVSSMPQSLVDAFIGALSRLKKYRIFWRIGTKIELAGVDLETLPDHINITTFLPQSDLLASKKVKLFVTNGGMNSIMEALTAGVPMLGVPLFGNNCQNMAKLRSKGVATIIDKNTITSSTLYAAMRHVLETPSYSRIASEMSKELRERPTSAFDRVLNSIEHVARLGSAKFVRDPPTDRSKGVRLLLQASNIDFYVIAMLALTLCIFFAYSALRLSLAFIIPSNSKRADKPTSAVKNTKKKQS